MAESIFRRTDLFYRGPAPTLTISTPTACHQQLLPLPGKAHWLAHVPEDRFDRFWGAVDGALAPGGHVIVIDVAPEEQRIEEHIHEHESIPLTRRRLRDGRQYDVVKKYWEPEELIERIRPLGFEGAGTKIGTEDGFGFVVWDVVRGSDDQS